MVENIDLEVAIEEMKELLDHQYESINAIKSNANAILSAASLIIALMGTFQLVNVNILPAYFPWYSAGLVLAVLLYLALMVFCILILLPVRLSGAIAPDWNVIHEAYVGKKEREILEQRLSNYLNAIKLNEKVISGRARLATWAGLALPVIVVILLLLSLVPRSPMTP